MTAPKHKGDGHEDWPLAKDAGDAIHVLVPLSEIVNMPSEDELRMSGEELARLADDIKENGLDQEVTMRRVDGGFEIVFGRHRAYAHHIGGYRTVPTKLRVLDDKQAAVRTIQENLLRKDLTPYEQARDWKAALETGLTQTQLSDVVGVSQPVISKRLKLLELPEAIARLAGGQLRLEDAPLFKPLQGHDDLAQRVAQVLESHSGARPVALMGTLDEALCRGKDARACLPFVHWGQFIDRVAQGWHEQDAITRNATYRKDILALEHLVFKEPRAASARNAEVIVCLDVDGATEAAQAAKKRIEAKDKKSQPTSAPTRSSPQKPPEQQRAERIRNKERNLQLECMVDHVAKQEAFGEDLVKHAYRQFLASVGQVASRKVEQQALAAILGEYAPPERETSWGAIERPLSRGCPELVDQLWDEDRLALDRYVAAVVHLQAGGYDHHVTDDQVLKFTTGKTGKQLATLATAAVDGPKKPPAKKEPSGHEKAMAERERDTQRRKEYPNHCLWGRCRERFKTESERDEHMAECKHAMTAKRPKAAAGKECPECKVIVERKGRGKAARLVCFCTPEIGVPAEVPA